MTLFAGAFLLVVVGISAIIIRVLRKSEDETTSYATNLKELNAERRAHVVRLNHVLETMTERLQLENSLVESKLVELKKLGQSTLIGSASSSELSASTVLNLIGAPHQSARGSVLQIVAMPGSVPDDVSAEEFRKTIANVQMIRAQQGSLPPFFPREPDLPVYFILPKAGRPESSSSAESVVATEDHESAFLLLMAMLQRVPEIRAERGTVSTGSSPGEWENLKGHILTFCRERRNPLTAALLQHPLTRSLFAADFYTGEDGQGIILDGRKYLVPIEESTTVDADRTRPERVDLALVARISNPWYPKARALIVAGNKAYGTWGAAHYLKDHWDDLMGEVGEGQNAAALEQVNFACALRVQVTYGVSSSSQTSRHSVPVDAVDDTVTVVKIKPRSVTGTIQMITRLPAA